MPFCHLSEAWAGATQSPHANQSEPVIDRETPTLADHVLLFLGRSGGEAEYYDIFLSQKQPDRATNEAMLDLLMRKFVTPLNERGDNWALTEDGWAAYRSVDQYCQNLQPKTPLPR